MKIFLYNIFVAVFGAYICWSNCRPFLFFMLVVFLTVFFWHIKFIKLLFWISFFNQYNKLSYPWIRQTVTYIYSNLEQVMSFYYAVFFVYNHNLIIKIFILVIIIIIFIFFENNFSLVPQMGLLGSLLVFFSILFMAFNFKPFYFGFQFMAFGSCLENSIFNLNMTFGVDGISLYFLILTSFIIFLCVFLEGRPRPRYFFSLLEEYIAVRSNKAFFIALFFIELFLLIAFTSLDLFIFFIFFESILIPMFFIIGFFGSGRRKIKAAYYFFMYSITFSLFSLFLIIYLYYIAGTTSLLRLSCCSFSYEQQILAWFLLFMTFAAKIPIFPFHFWLPEAHVEAPTVGSIVLASLLLKLGGYGFIRFSLALFPEGTYFFLPLVNTLCVLSIFYASFAALYQIDLKKIIAYSSIAHMNLSILGIFSLSSLGVQGAIFSMVSHGIVSSALFLLVGSIYDRFRTRSLLYLGGLVQIMPMFSFYFFFFSICNISFPGSSSFIGEILILLGIFSSNIFIFLTMIVGSFLSVVYSLKTFSFVCFGTLPNKSIYKFAELPDVNREEYLCLNIFFFLALFLGICPNSFLELSYIPVKLILLKY